MTFLISTWGPLAVAVLCHGAGHWVAARCVGVHMKKLVLTPTGMRMIAGEGGFPSYFAEVICALGGPLANLMGGLLGGWIANILSHINGECRHFVAVSFYLALLNLLPVRYFDGGRVLYCLICRGKTGKFCNPDGADRVLGVTTAFFLSVLWLTAVYLLLRTGSAVSLYMFCIQLFRAVTEGDRNLSVSMGD